MIIWIGLLGYEYLWFGFVFGNNDVNGVWGEMIPFWQWQQS